jgi:DDE superfamily endonuclease
MAPSVVPEVLDGWMRPFRGHFTAAVWRHALVLVAGAVLAPGRRTVAAALRVMGFAEAAGFAAYHRVLSHGHWCSRALAQRLLLLLVAAFVPHGPVVVGLDDTIERRRGKRINAKGIYRDPVRSSRGHFVKASGLRWLCAMLLAPVPCAGCVWGLPFLTVLAPSERYAAEQGKRHKKLTDWGRQALLQVARWLPGRRVVAVADSSFSAIALLRDLAPHLTVVTRLRLDACLCDPPPPRRPRTRGRPPVKGARLPSLAERLRSRRTPWRRASIDGWYGRRTRRLDIATGTALWHHPGMRVPIRWGPAQCAERCVTRAARRSRRPSSAPTWRRIRSTSCAGSFVGGGPRPPSKKPVGTSASRPSGSGPTLPSYAPRPRCSPCSPS